MADIVNTGATANDGSGDNLRAAFQQINQRFQQLFGLVSYRGAWVTGTAYQATPARDWFSKDGVAYIVAQDHTAGTFATDMAAGRFYSADHLQVILDLASSGGAGMVGYGLRTVADAFGDRISVKRYGAVGNGVADDTAAIQAAADDLAASGGCLYFPRGDYKITTRITFTGDNIQVVLDHNAGIIHNTPDYAAFKFNGARCSVVGGLGRGFIGPAAWDGVNTAPTYGVIWFTGNGGFAQTRLVNVRKVGIWFKDVVDGTVDGSIIEGNYPSGSWTGTEVGHIGVGFDTSTANAGNFKLVNSTIKSCVQGCLPANYGAGGAQQGIVITGNVFDGCWNHGVYTITTNGAVITGNNFNRCQIPVVVTGNGNTIAGNTIYTSVDAAGDERDSVGISVRDGSRNVITGNTIKGVLTAANLACISIQDVNGTGQLNDNVVSSNTIHITAGAGPAIRILGATNSCSRNIVQGNNITCPGAGVASGAVTINGLAAGGNVGNKVLNNVIVLTAQSEGFYATYQTASEFRGNTVEVAWSAGSAANVFAARWFAATTCATQDNTLLCRTGNGANITFYAYREDSSAVGNFLGNIINAVAGSATYALAVLVSNSGLTINQVGTGVPNLHAKIGSVWRRSDGGAGSTLYVKESGTDSSGWVAK